MTWWRTYPYGDQYLNTALCKSNDMFFSWILIDLFYQNTNYSWIAVLYTVLCWLEFRQKYTDLFKLTRYVMGCKRSNQNKFEHDD